MTIPDRKYLRRRAIAWVLISVSVMTFLSLYFSGKAVRESERKWCTVVSTLIVPGEPATTERGRIIQEEMVTLYREFDCEGVDRG